MPQPPTSTTVQDIELVVPRPTDDARTPNGGTVVPGGGERGTGELGSAALARTPSATQQPRSPARGTPGRPPLDDTQLRALIFAPERTRATWIESELSRAPVTIQVARRVRTVVAALIKDPPPRPQLLIVDFDSISPAELLELHTVRHEGWDGRMIGIGAVPRELCRSLEIDRVIPALVRDSLLDCVAGTRHATETVPIPMGVIATLGLASERSAK